MNPVPAVLPVVHTLPAYQSFTDPHYTVCLTPFRHFPDTLRV
jgi:hypothetical protein